MNPNVDIFYFINNTLSNPIFDLIMPQLTNIGGFISLLVLCIIAIIISKHYNNEKYSRISKLCLYSLLLSAGIVACLKLGIVEERPFNVLSHVNQLVVPSEPNSFPSGHTSSTFSIITVLIQK